MNATDREKTVMMLCIVGAFGSALVLVETIYRHVGILGHVEVSRREK
jgi:hypothetical protein